MPQLPLYEFLMDFDFWPKSSRQKVGVAENGQNIDFEAKIMV